MKLKNFWLLLLMASLIMAVNIGLVVPVRIMMALSAVAVLGKTILEIVELSKQKQSEGNHHA